MGVQLYSRKSYKNKEENKSDEIRQINYKLDYIISLINSTLRKRGGQ
tara:strand:+ start:280 stop:420 length:141 start_codon:yes stop_codon:yes gene_type:complete